jgi:hypothetical protein
MKALVEKFVLFYVIPGIYLGTGFVLATELHRRYGSWWKCSKDLASQESIKKIEN